MKWRDSMDRDETTIMGTTYNNKLVSTETLGQIVSKAQEENIKLGYGSDSQEWKKRKFNITTNMLRRAEKREKDVENYKKRKNLQEKFGSM